MRWLLKDIKRHGIKYAALMLFWLFLDKYNFGWNKLKISKLQDKVENVLDRYDNHLKQLRPVPPIESVSNCNCIHYWSCEYCPQKGTCNDV